MHCNDKQRKWLIVVILVGFALIIGSYVGAFDAIDNTRETPKNEATLQVPENQGISAHDAGLIRVGDTEYATQQRHLTWPDAGDGHCLLVVVAPPHNEPDDLTNDNTVKIPIDLCFAFIQSLRELVQLDLLNVEDLRFKQSY